MTDRNQERYEAQEERERTLQERAEDVRRRPPGEEFDPDSTRQVPPLDEDGEVVEVESVEDISRDH
ncbi:MAG TPA: hypothetical protein VNZ55_05480 [Thermomicrobiales bacterium]|nr:hypothetical protein [Thermomicrobiales bacterium]